jgi:hypothetical protein
MLTAWGRIAHRLADEHRTERTEGEGDADAAAALHRSENVSGLGLLTHEAPDLNTVHDEQGDVAVAADAATTCWESNTSQNRLI